MKFRVLFTSLVLGVNDSHLPLVRYMWQVTLALLVVLSPAHVSKDTRPSAFFMQLKTARASE